jgi:hypothetical protein
MQKLFAYTCLIFFISLSACNKAKQLFNINVDIPYNYQETIPTIPGDTVTTILPHGGIPLPFPTVAVATNSRQYIAQYGTATNLVLNVYLKSLAIQIQTPPNQNFNFLDYMDVYISSKTQPEVIVATQHSVPKGQNTLTLVPDTTINLKNYFLEDTIYFRLNAHINAVPPAGEKLNIATVLHMLANPLQ